MVLCHHYWLAATTKTIKMKTNENNYKHSYTYIYLSYLLTFNANNMIPYLLSDLGIRYG